MKPYTSAADRARELYLLPTAPAPQRVLELCCGREPLFSATTWPGASHTLCKIDKHTRAAALPFAGESFDLVILHKALDDLADAQRWVGDALDAHDLLRSLAALLVPGGAVAGCVGNKTSPLRWLHPREPGDSPPYLSLGGCRRLLASAGFTGIRLFNLLPDWQSPLRLIEHNAAVSRVAFRREFQDAWHTRGGPHQWARSAALACGLVPHLETTVFFWGCKPC